MTFAIADSSSGAASAACDEARDDVRGRREEQHPADDPVELLQPELQPGGDAEVAAAAADRPEEVRVAGGVGEDDPAVRGDQLGREQVVDREPVLADEEAHSAAQRDAADADRAGVPETGREPVLRGRHRVLARGQTGLRPRRALAVVDGERPHLGQVDHDAPVGHAVAGRAVAAAAHRELQPGIPGREDRASDVGCVRHPHDRGRAAVDPALEDGASAVVLVVAGQDHPAGQLPLQLSQSHAGQVLAPRGRCQCG